MSDKVFTAKKLDECLRIASTDLNIPIKDLNYRITEQKNGFFSKKVSIAVSTINQNEKKEDLNGSVMIKNGKVIVKNPKEGGVPASVMPFKKGKVLVNGKLIQEKQEIFDGDNVELILDDTESQDNKAERRLDINISHDKMKAFARVFYVPQNVYSIKDIEESLTLDCRVKVKEQIMPKTYSIDEIKEALLESGIKYGVILKNIIKLACQGNEEEVLVAEGKQAIHGTDDVIHSNFSDKNHKKFEQSKEGTIDYKSIGHIQAVKSGDILITKEEGIEGEDGIDVTGALIKHNKGKRHEIKIGEGCEFKDSNTVIATIEGKVSYRGNVVSVHQIHEIHDDVDVKSGNIQFIGDVYISGSVKEGMKVEAGNEVIINKNVEHAKIVSIGNMSVGGNVINSELNAGGENVTKLNKLKSLEELYETLLNLIATVDHIKKFNLLGKEVRDGEIVKVLIENKFKHIIPLCNNFIELTQIESTPSEQELVDKLRKRLIGFAPLNIHDIIECDTLVNLLKDNINILKGSISVPVNMTISYCQDSVIKSSGDILITGKGEYVSSIISHGNIEFTNPNSLVRGGMIQSKNYIKCKNVGSEGGVSTKLIVEEKGDIWVDKAYQNTHFAVGGKEYVLEIPSKEIHAYLDENDDLIVDKFVL